MNAQSTPRSRADVNRANAAHSSDPKTSAGKARSSQNSFKHGLYSEQLIVGDENPLEFDALRASLRREHQPANTTEEILVDELAQNFWRMRRFRGYEATAWDSENLNAWIETGRMAVVHRFANAAERSFHKTLATLTQLQKQRGFVPSKCAEAAPPPAFEVEEAEVENPAPGFVPAKTAIELAAFEHFGYFPEDHDKFVESLVDGTADLPDPLENVTTHK